MMTKVIKSSTSPQREFLLEALAQLGVTQEAFAASIGTTRRTVENWMASPDSAAYRKMPDMVWLFVEEILAPPAAEITVPVGVSASQPQRQFLLDAMTILGMNRVEFAKRIGVPRRTLENWLADPGATEHRTLSELARRFVKLILLRAATVTRIDNAH
ncbi:TPA: hypothetical protein ACYLN4_000719 [Burkholderia lata]